MTAYDVMQSLRGAGDDVNRIQESIDMRRDAATAITAGYGERGGHGSGDNDRMAAYAAKVEELQQRLDARRALWAREMEICLSIADELEGMDRTVLWNYYAKAWTLEAIAQSAGFTATYVRKRKAALDDMLRCRAVPDIYEVKNGD